MQYLNYTDLLVRKQLITIKLGCLGTEYADALRLGKKCANDLLEDIILLKASLDLICCYNPIGNTNTGTIQIYNPDDTNANIEIFVNGTSISGLIVDAEDASSIAAVITTYQLTHGNVYTTTVVDEQNLTITSNTCGTGGNLEYLVYSIASDSVFELGLTGMTNNVCIGDNCITEQELHDLLDRLVYRYKFCFQPIGFSYRTP